MLTSLIVYWLELKKILFQKYPLTPRLAYEKAKLAANQAGRERNSFLQLSQSADGPPNSNEEQNSTEIPVSQNDAIPNNVN